MATNPVNSWQSSEKTKLLLISLSWIIITGFTYLLVELKIAIKKWKFFKLTGGSIIIILNLWILYILPYLYFNKANGKLQFNWYVMLVVGLDMFLIIWALVTNFFQEDYYTIKEALRHMAHRMAAKDRTLVIYSESNHKLRTF